MIEFIFNFQKNGNGSFISHICMEQLIFTMSHLSMIWIMNFSFLPKMKLSFLWLNSNGTLVKLCTACSRLICFRMVDRSESEHLPQQQEARRGDLLFRQMGVYWSIIMRLESTSRLRYFPSLQKKIFPFLSA